MNPKVDFYFNNSKKWQEELEHLRAIVLDSNLTEELKWGCPCYTLEKSNIVLIHEFKEYCALLFFKGVLLKDPKGVLIQQTENVQVARQMRFTNVQEIVKLKATIKAYIKAAIEIEKAGLKVPLKKATEFKMVEEFKKKLDKNAALKKAFHDLTPGRQRAYLLHFSSAKQSATREVRIEKAAPLILKGKGLND
ncbi:MAG: hypothetical protein JWM14_1526 [Chitinophagaceae bacterium]|nr:hypothetical protein [Chitinophagaceae bacterium]